MLEKLRSMLVTEKSRNLALTAGGMLALLGGRKLTALTMFGKGMQGLEKAWREAHPEFEGGFQARWQLALDFYEATHKDPTNRKLHIVGIPFIVGGTVGLLLFPAYRPLWGLSAAAFTGGWILNFIGHGLYEKSAPAFADDPLSFLAGPVWDFQQIFRGKSNGQPAESSWAGSAQTAHASA